MATIFCFYILTFTDEFRAIKMHHPVVGQVQMFTFKFIDRQDSFQIVFMEVIEYNVLTEPTDASA